jgi:hypothetical protein
MAKLPYKAYVNLEARPPDVVNLRCPTCGRLGAFGAVKSDISDAQWKQPWDEAERGEKHISEVRMGLRRCPNPECYAPIAVLLRDNKLAEAYPRESVHFDATNLPQDIRRNLEEAITCHANGCYRAAAIMMRRVLEALCADKEATGDSLKGRLADLGKRIGIPNDLLATADNLSLLGSDAAQIEAKTFDDVEKEEADIAIELAKELLKATYQYADLKGRLDNLKKPPEFATE